MAEEGRNVDAGELRQMNTAAKMAAAQIREADDLLGSRILPIEDTTENRLALAHLIALNYATLTRDR